MTTPPEDIAALFGLAPESPPPADPSADADDAAEAALLAAELAATIEGGGVADDAPDSRTHLRLPVSWPARMRLPAGRVIELQVRNVSERGVGLMSDEDVPSDTVVDFEMDVPRPDADGATTPVQGRIKTTYTIAHGAQRLCGGTWQVPPDGLGLVTLWIERLRA